MSWTRRVRHPSKIVNVGDMVDVEMCRSPSTPGSSSTKAPKYVEVAHLAARLAGLC